MNNFLYLTEAEIASLVNLNDAITALEQGLKWQGQQAALNFPKALGVYGHASTAHSLGSAFPQEGWVGFKTWVNSNGDASAVFTMFEAVDGSLAAIMEAFTLGQLRTAAIAGLATRMLADPCADSMAIIGTGAQAMAQVAAVAAVRPLRRLFVYSPTAARRRAFVEKAQDKFSFPVEECGCVFAAVRDAAIVTLATRAREPFLDAAMLGRGTHINAMGAILPQHQEFGLDVLERADMVVVDDIANIRRKSREFTAFYEGGGRDWDEVRHLSDMILERQERPPGTDLTLFKSLGMGISDLAVAVMALRRAREKGLGQAMALPVRAEPHWQEMNELEELGS